MSAIKVKKEGDQQVHSMCGNSFKIGEKAFMSVAGRKSAVQIWI